MGGPIGKLGAAGLAIALAFAGAPLPTARADDAGARNAAAEDAYPLERPLMATYAAAADRGDARAARAIGLRTLHGVGVARDPEAARRWLRMAAERGDAVAQRVLGHMLQYGPEAERHEALRWLERAAAADAAAAYALAERLAADGGALPPAARGHLEAAAAAGHALAIERLLRADAARPAAPAEAAAWGEAAARGDAEAAYRAGLAAVTHTHAAGDHARGLAWLEQAAAAGHRLAAAYLAQRADGARDAARARRWRETAATLGVTTAAVRLGRAYLRGEDDLPRDPAAAMPWFGRAAAAGDAEAAYTYGLLLKYGADGTPPRLDAALTQLRAAAEGGHYQAIAQLATFRAGPGGGLVTTDPPVALAEATRRAEAGDAAAQLAVARMWRGGVSTWPDDRQARTWLRRAAEAGLAAAQLEYAGYGALADREDRVTWLERAARQGLPAAVVALADALVQEGRPDRAMPWYRRAADAGDPAAIAQVAHALDQGRGLPRHARDAARWLRRAGEAGRPDAWTALGRLREAGEGLPADPGGAAEAYRRGADAGDPAAARRLAMVLLAGHGGPRDVARAVALLRAAHEGEDVGATLALGELLEAGRLVPRDPVAAHALYEAAAEAADPDDAEAARLFMRLGRAREATGDIRGALDAYDGVPLPEAGFRAARLLERPGPGRDEAAAWARHRAGAEAFEDGALGPFAALADLPRGLESEAEAVRAALARAADAGHPAALVAAAWLVDRRGAEPATLAKAREQLERAAERGDPRAAALRGRLADAGGDGQPPSAEALAWYRRAAAGLLDGRPAVASIAPAAAKAWADAMALAEALADASAYGAWAPLTWRGIDIGAVETAADARKLLARHGITAAGMLEEEIGRHAVRRRGPSDEAGLLANLFLRKAELADDPAAARRWEATAAELGSPIAQLAVARRLEAAGRPADLVRAHVWYNLAGAGGHEGGRRGRTRVARRLGPAQVARAEDEARDWWSRWYPPAPAAGR